MSPESYALYLVLGAFLSITIALRAGRKPSISFLLWTFSITGLLYAAYGIYISIQSEKYHNPDAGLGAWLAASVLDQFSPLHLIFWVLGTIFIGVALYSLVLAYTPGAPRDDTNMHEPGVLSYKTLAITLIIVSALLGISTIYLLSSLPF